MTLLHQLAQDPITFRLCHGLDAVREVRYLGPETVTEFQFWRWAGDFTATPIRPISAHVSRTVTLGHGYTSNVTIGGPA